MSMELYEELKNPKVYGTNVKSVNLIQTHISFVALTGEYAYKIKKPVNFGFLDFSTLEKRKKFCEEEVRLNRRLCPDMYIGVFPLVKKGNKIFIGKEGEVIDYAVKMREFSQNKLMTNLLKEDKVNEDTIDKIVEILVDFYKSSDRSKDIDRYGSIEIIKKNTEENFEQTSPFINVTISKPVYDFIKEVTNDFLNKRKDAFEKRIKEGFICDCHGDLHSGNIVINDKVYIFDCIEFNDRFRYGDVASDIAFLAMDLDFLGFPYISAYFIEKYIEQSKDFCISDVLNFYKCYRAYVRGKVNSFKLKDQNVGDREKDEITRIAKRYFDLAFYYAKLCYLEIKKHKPLIFATTGLVGTGKTTVAKKISIDYSARLISTDIVRKELLEGIDRFERRYDAYNTGLYSPERMVCTYEKIIELAEECIKKGNNVVLDGTFKTKSLRDKVVGLSEKTKSNYVFLYCNCPENVIKKYLDSRIKKKTISDGRWEIYIEQKKDFEKPKKDERFVEIDVSNKRFEYQISIFNKILNSIQGDNNSMQGDNF